MVYKYVKNDDIYTVLHISVLYTFYYKRYDQNYDCLVYMFYVVMMMMIVMMMLLVVVMMAMMTSIMNHYYIIMQVCCGLLLNC